MTLEDHPSYLVHEVLLERILLCPLQPITLSTMPPLPPPADDEEYDSAADSDFDASLSPSSGDESEKDDIATVAKAGANKAKYVDGDMEMGSGDEGIVAQGRKKKRRKGKGKGEGDDEQDGDGAIEADVEVAAGIRVRLRSGRGG